MTTRSCGTCRHFAAGDFSAAGWCQHPRRTSNGSVRLLVQPRQRPACRDAIGADQYAAAPDVVPDVVPTTHAAGEDIVLSIRWETEPLT